jgi:hypothetical protein
VKRVNPAYYDLGRWLLAQEAGPRAGSTAMVAAAETVFQKLQARLTILFSQEGYGSLLARALHLAQARQPLLQGVAVEWLPNSPPAGAHLRGLQESLEGSEADSVAEALAALLGNFLQLLATFIGEDMSQRELRRIWPALYFPAAGPNSEEAKQ